MSLFLDTSGLYAFFVRTEERHGEVLRALRRALEEGRDLWVTNYVLVETTALLQHRFGLAPVRDLTDRLVPLLRVHWVEEALHGRAAARLLRTDCRSLSLVDCVSFEFMRVRGLREALALDRQFAEEGFRLLPSRAGR